MINGTHVGVSSFILPNNATMVKKKKMHIISTNITNPEIGKPTPPPKKEVDGFYVAL